MADKDPAQPVTPLPDLDVAGVLCRELKVQRPGVERTLALLGEGATVPFMARYRKEVTGGLDEVQLQAIKDRAEELAELAARRQTVLEAIARPGQPTDAL